MTKNPERRNKFVNPPRLRFAFAFALACVGPALLAHPVHTSLAEATYNRDSQRLEVALRVFADDLLVALGREASRPVSYEKTPASELNALTHRYVAGKFHVRTRSGELQPLHWLGREFDQDDGEQRLWLYFEVLLPDGPEGARMQHALFHEFIRGQRNTIALRDGSRRATLVFLRDTGEKTVKFD